MNLTARIARAETMAFGAGLNAARVLEMVQRGEFDLLTDAELDWLVAGGAQLSPKTRAELDRLFESFSDADLDAICESRTLSAKGQSIQEQIYKLLGVKE